MIASTSTGTVSLVRVCSATNCVVRSRVSINAVTLSRIGTIQNSPGPLTAKNLPARKTTACSHCRAILSEHYHSQQDHQRPGQNEPGEADHEDAETGEDHHNGERYRIWAHGSRLVSGALKVEFGRTVHRVVEQLVGGLPQVAEPGRAPGSGTVPDHPGDRCQMHKAPAPERVLQVNQFLT